MYSKIYIVRVIILFLLLSPVVGNVVNGQTDSSFGVIYQCTAIVPFGSGDAMYPYNQIKTLSPGGLSSGTIYNGQFGPCYNAITGDALPKNSVLKNASALAYDVNANRLYFINNTTTNSPAEELCYIDLNTAPVSAKKFVGYPLETNAGTGYNITRMTFSSDGYGYAMTENGQDFIRFSIDTVTGLPLINRLGVLINDSVNGAHDILAETGGDICSDGSGRLYFVPNSGNVYTIDPGTHTATYYGTISGMPKTCNSVAMTADGHLYIGGNYQNVYKVTLSTLTASSVIASTSNVFRSGDYASYSFAVQPARISTAGTPFSNNANPVLLNENEAVHVTPNPFLQDLSVTIQLNKKEPVQVRLIDFFGRNVFSASQKVGTGVTTLHVSVPAGLSKGIYVLELSAGNNRFFQKKLIKQ
jgi:hypothetical protein